MLQVEDHERKIKGRKNQKREKKKAKKKRLHSMQAETKKCCGGVLSLFDALQVYGVINPRPFQVLKDRTCPLSTEEALGGVRGVRDVRRGVRVRRGVGG